MPNQVLKGLRNNKKTVESQLSEGTKKLLGLDKLYLPEVDTNISLDDFYKYFEPLMHPETKKPVTKLADHQREVWDDQYSYLLRAYPKSQKIYLSTTFILEDIKHALTDAM